MLGIHKGRYLEDFNRNQFWVQSEADLIKLYELWEDQRIARAVEKLGAIAPGGQIPEMEKDNYSDWLVKRGICPHAIVSKNSQYHFENCVLLDGEHGLTLPDSKLSMTETPQIYYQALSIIRREKTKVRQEEDAKNNSNQNRGG